MGSKTPTSAWGSPCGRSSQLCFPLPIMSVGLTPQDSHSWGSPITVLLPASEWHFCLQSPVPPDRAHPSAACQQEHDLRLCGRPTPRRTFALDGFVACWDSLSLKLSHVGRPRGPRGGSQALAPEALAPANWRWQKVAAASLLPAPSTFPFHVRGTGSAAQAAGQAASQHRPAQVHLWMLTFLCQTMCPELWAWVSTTRKLLVVGEPPFQLPEKKRLKNSTGWFPFEGERRWS